MSEALIRSRSSHLGTVTRATNSVAAMLQRSPEEISLEEASKIEAALERCEEQEQKIHDLDQRIKDKLTEEEVEAAIFDNETEKVDENHLKVRSIIKTMRKFLEKLTSTSNDNSTDAVIVNSRSGGSGLKLPKLSLPTFSGKYDEWTPFYDLFIGTVDTNSSLSDIQKLHYLKSSLRDEPAKLLAHLPITSQNYAVAVQLLRDNYANKRMISHTHLQSIFEFPTLKYESAEQLRKLVSTYVENTMTLQAMNLDTSQCDFIWVYTIAKKLDPETRKQWELYSPGDDIQSMQQMKRFLERARALEASSRQQPKANQERRDDSRRHPNPKQNAYHGNLKAVTCLCCSEPHKIYQCEKFKAMSFDDKQQLVKAKKLCYNCLRSGHTVKECKSESKCQTCKKGHHTLLQRATNDGEEGSGSKLFVGHSGILSSQTILPTVLVPIFINEDKFVECRALLDSGAESSFMGEQYLQRLGLHRRKATFEITGIGGVTTNANLGTVDIKMQTKSKRSIYTIAVVMKKLTDLIPSVTPKASDLPITNSLKLSDPNFSQSRHVDIILGGEVYEQIVGYRKIQFSKTLYARDTEFGWTVCGSLGSKPAPRIQAFRASVDFDLAQFWKLEEVPKFNSSTKKEMACEDFFVKTTKLENNRFIVKLPFKENKPLGESYSQAERRYLLLERKLDQKPLLKLRYKAFVDEFKDLEHMEPVPLKDLAKPSDKTFYLPHHCVFKEDSTTTKLRVVFDGSAKTSTGNSLNDSLMVGATVQDDLFSISIRFRTYPVALSADIAKMYRQIEIEENDRDFHRILWRDDKNEQLQHLRMKRVTYGVASSAFHSTRCLIEVANRTKNKEVEHHLRHSFYVDDFLGGANSIAEAETLVNSMCQELELHGFPIRKWSSNQPSIVDKLPKNLRETTDSLQLFSDEYKVKTLGISWQPNQDYFFFKSTVDPIDHQRNEISYPQ